MLLKRYKLWVALLLFIFLFPFGGFVQASEHDSQTGSTASSATAAVALDGKQIVKKISQSQIPFIENQGQIVNQSIKYYAQTFKGTVFVGENGAIRYSMPVPETAGGDTEDQLFNPAVYSSENVKDWVLEENLINALYCTPEGINKSPTAVNYFMGSQQNWTSNINTYDTLSLGEIYPGINLSLRAYGGSIEKIFTLNPGADVGKIKLEFQGVEAITENDKGELEIETDAGLISFSQPVAYQDKNGVRNYVQARYDIDQCTYGFQVGDYDESLPLIIDPLLASTFVGGNYCDTISSMAIDSAGNVYAYGYITGSTIIIESVSSGEDLILNADTDSDGDYPAGTNTFDSSYDDGNLFIIKLDSELSQVLAVTYIGGGDGDLSSSILVDSTDNIIISGSTSSVDFPTTTGAYDTSINDEGITGGDVFIAKLDSSLSVLLASTYIGGGEMDTPTAAIQDSSGNIYITGHTNSTNYPTTPGACQTASSGENDAFISKINADLTNLLASSYIGGSSNEYAESLAFGNAGDLYLAGSTCSYDYPTSPGSYDQTFNAYEDVFITRMDSSLENIISSTFLGGNYYEWSSSLAVSDSDDVFLTGSSCSLDFPAYTGTANGWYIFAVRLDSSLSELLASTTIGGDEDNVANTMVLDGNNNVIIAGYTYNSNYPAAAEAYDTEYSGNGDGFISVLSSDLNNIISSTFLGGNDWDAVNGIVLDDEGNIYAFGETASMDFPVTEGTYDQEYDDTSDYADTFICRLSGDLSAADEIPKDLLGIRPYCFYGNNSVNMSTGNFIRQETDVLIPGPGPGLHFTRFYNSLDDYGGPQGKGWTNNYNVHLTINQDGSISAAYADGHVYTFDYDGSAYISPAGCYENLTSGPDDGYTLTFKNHTQYIFDSYGKLINIIDQNNNIILLTYSNDLLAAATNQTTGKSLSFSYDANNRLADVADPAGRTVYYSYDSSGNLTGVENLNGGTTTYQYDYYGLTSITSPDGSTILTNTYDSNNRVIQQADGENNTWQYTYNDVQTSLTGPLGDITVCGRDANYRGISLLDPLNYLTTFTYDDNNNCTGITDPNDNQVTYQYDANGNLISLTNAFGTTGYQYDGNNNLTLITDPGARTTQLSYDANNNLNSITDALGATTSYTYYSDGQLQTQTNPEIESGIGTISYTYSDGLPYTITDAVSMITTCSYDEVGRLLSITDNDSKTTSYTYDTAGNLLSITDPLGHSWNYQYDANYRLISTTDANNNNTQYAYDNNGNLTQVIDALNHTTTYTYDSENQLIQITDPRGGTTAYTYDLNGQVGSVTDPLGNTWNYSYDEVGNITQIVDALGNSAASCTYDPQKYLLTSVQDALGNTVSGQYDTLGRLTQTTDPLDQSKQYAYDDLDQHIQTIDAVNGQASQEFDELGNRCILIDSNNNQRQYSFDLAGRLIESSSATGSQLYAYNQAGLLGSFINGRGQERTWQYDDAGRLVSQSDPDGSIACTYDANGNLLTVTDATGTITRQYDALNRVISYTDAQGNTIGYTYDEAGNLTVLTYPDGKQVQYTYDAANRFIQVTDWADRITSYSYDANGRLLETHRPDGSIETRTYNEAGRLIQISDESQAGNQINLFDLSYDEAGNLIDEYSNLSDPANAGEDSGITCTSDNRLATYNGQEVSYDADGNMTCGPLDGQMTSYSFDSRNRLTAVENSSYTYDAEGNRTGVNIDGEQYDDIINPQAALSQVLVRTAADDSQTFYVYGLGLIGEENQNGCQVYHYDLRGSTVKLTDIAGSVTDSFQYNEYGKLTDHTGSSDTPFLYNGQYGIMTDGNGLVYMRARYYNPDVHRFVSTDILEGNISDPLSLNRYAYCSNNPITYLDPTGYVSFNPGDWLNAHNPGDWLNAHNPGDELNEFNDEYIGGPLNQIASGDLTPLEDLASNYSPAVNWYEAVSGETLFTGESLTYEERNEKGYKGNELFTSGAIMAGTGGVKGAGNVGKFVPNPFGKSGGPIHQGKIQGIAQEMRSKGYDVSFEKYVKTPGGNKSFRYGDILVTNPATGEQWIVQVGKQTQAGNPVSREIKAIEDLQNAGWQVDFFPYN